MKNFSKILVSVICLAAFFTSCVKEELHVVDYVTLEVDLSRADGDESVSNGPSSVEQGDGIGDVMLWAFKIDTEGRVTDTATGWRTVSNVNTFRTIDVHLPLPTCDGSQDYMVVAVLNKAEFGGASFSSGTTYTQLKAMTFDASARPFWQTYPNDNAKTPEDMPVSNWAKIRIAGKSYNNGVVTSYGNTHSSNCYQLNLPVYRAVAKAQLYFRKENDNFKLEITDARILSKMMPTKGAVLSATVGSQTDTKNTEATTDDVTITLGNPDNSTTPSWYETAAITAANPGEVLLKNSKNADNATIFSTVSRPKNDASTEGNPAVTEYVWAGSAFLYENPKGWTVSDWTTYDCSKEPADNGNGGYYMVVKYKIDDGAEQIGYVPMPSFVRNHDYQVRALVEAGGKLSLSLVVKEWDESSHSWSYTDVVECTKKLTWSEGTNIQEAENDTNVQEVILPKSDDIANQTATCSFTISAPVDAAYWMASFVRGDINAFKFVTTVGEVSTVKGEIGKPATLTIRTTNHQVDDTKMAYLDIVVVTNDGRTLSANSALMPNLSYRIVQELTKQNN